MEDTEPQKKFPKNLWHLWLARLLKELLPEVGISVQTGFPLMTQSPEADLLLIKRDDPSLLPKQMALLPDGIRECQASHILLEFKYTESVNEKTVRQALGYDTFYRRGQKLGDNELQTFLLSARTPQPSSLAKFGYEKTQQPGVYHSQYPLVNALPLLSLNELPNEPHNAFIKCFASHLAEKKKAFNTLKRSGFKHLKPRLKRFLSSLWEYWFVLKGEEMNIELTPEQLALMSQTWGKVYLEDVSIEEFLSRFDKKEILAQKEQILAHFEPADILPHFKPEDILVQFEPAKRLAGLTPAEIEDYLKQLKQQEKLH
jgi:hypothetical protein